MVGVLVGDVLAFVVDLNPVFLGEVLLEILVAR